MIPSRLSPFLLILSNSTLFSHSSFSLSFHVRFRDSKCMIQSQLQRQL